MSTPRGRRQKHEEHEEHVDERWMASYMDMVTVLMCMFIVLFAMSTVDANKFDQLRNSLATGFGQKNVGKIDTAQGTVVPADKVDSKDQGFTSLDLALKEVKDLTDLEDKINASLASKGLQNTVDYQIDQRGLTIRLVDSQTFFESNSVALVGVAPSVLDSIAAVLAPSKYSVSVEGHADIRHPEPPYPTNWELSSGRAVEVTRRMVELGGIPGARISAVGYGDSRPLAPGDSPEAMAQNRRVDIVAISDAPEAVRALIPDALVESNKPPGEQVPEKSPSKTPEKPTTKESGGHAAGTPPDQGAAHKTSPFALPGATAGR
ncbi:OmpA/MotB family protein [Lacisediminihabitans changchengi]|uniref:Flagellar motor protein MotB n=1 Tax=Lacisediminihabitans changchengi TaxID=2787634 RepID=A0A934W481_9MICO|nr:flagellar motor protein MotB [Lacisediminihabitans changchengi]MBK4348676.1 flagellar motor protein MotB [Lacisediminihabitans changchengi]